MAYYKLGKDLVFPDPRLADPDGLIAIGGDLSIERLVLAYGNGIFPWYNSGEPILWWSPDPRYILAPKDLLVSKSLKKTVRKDIFQISMDTDFDKVLALCRDMERGGTWITPEMTRAYKRLHRAGFAHSVEVRKDGELAGGLYGVSLGKCFFGESMFHRISNASKVALFWLSRFLGHFDFRLIDCQVKTDHMVRMGASPVPREEFLELLMEYAYTGHVHGSWSKLFEKVRAKENLRP